MAQERSVWLEYPISQEYTTVENVMRRLGLLEGIHLQRELRAGTLRLGENPIEQPKEKLYPGYVLSWQDLRIRIIRDETEKHYRLLYSESWYGGLGRPEYGSPASGVPKI